eukprot:GEZU01039161.1.p1 GENE.GEZU01039161.1~~GEZU01039161.1.p1  ORF type:complete len:145 (-),score=26.28 GEZU01039161.1:22-456(-)
MNWLPGAASLAEHLDKKILVMLRDGRKLLGILRSFDQFANIVLEECTERICVGSYYNDLTLGLYIIRGENVVFLGDVDEEAEARLKSGQGTPMLIEVSLDQILELQKQERDEKERQLKLKRKILQEKGLSSHFESIVAGLLDEM